MTQDDEHSVIQCRMILQRHVVGRTTPVMDRHIALHQVSVLLALSFFVMKKIFCVEKTTKSHRPEQPEAKPSLLCKRQLLRSASLYMY